MSLFPEDWEEKARQAERQRNAMEKASRPKGAKCSNCIHHRGHEFSPKYHYCKLGRSRHTPNGYAKTKAGGYCTKWEGKP